jgi:hypothetical protein
MGTHRVVSLLERGVIAAALGAGVLQFVSIRLGAWVL